MRPNLTGQEIRVAEGPGGFDPNREAYLNRAAFSDPAVLSFGNAPPYLNVRQPMTVNESFGLFKDTKIVNVPTCSSAWR